jgi:hypothetical protein
MSEEDWNEVHDEEVSETLWREVHDEEVSEYFLRGGRDEEYFDETDFQEVYSHSPLMLEDIDDYEERDTYMYLFEIRLNDCLDIRLDTQKNRDKYYQVVREIMITPSHFVSCGFKGGCEFIELNNRYELARFKKLYSCVIEQFKSIVVYDRRRKN